MMLVEEEVREVEGEGDVAYKETKLSFSEFFSKKVLLERGSYRLCVTKERMPVRDVRLSVTVTSPTGAIIKSDISKFGSTKNTVRTSWVVEESESCMVLDLVPAKRILAIMAITVDIILTRNELNNTSTPKQLSFNDTTNTNNLHLLQSNKEDFLQSDKEDPLHTDIQSVGDIQLDKIPPPQTKQMKGISGGSNISTSLASSSPPSPSPSLPSASVPPANPKSQETHPKNSTRHEKEIETDQPLPAQLPPLSHPKEKNIVWNTEVSALPLEKVFPLDEGTYSLLIRRDSLPGIQRTLSFTIKVLNRAGEQSRYLNFNLKFSDKAHETTVVIQDPGCSLSVEVRAPSILKRLVPISVQVVIEKVKENSESLVFPDGLVLSSSHQDEYLPIGKTVHSLEVVC
eukprot:TRINITY_DN12383_c0_g1_i1.p2 TRINITY_DN12383_c0_g1~~TRINITY_DN12383_c0_g1_i1.p2  ORF type:complete len:400 (-),score=114.05 TRINITY_DN12383_c0_g1_i1:2122-3321(-)